MITTTTNNGTSSSSNTMYFRTMSGTIAAAIRTTKTDGEKSQVAKGVVPRCRKVEK